MSLALTFLVRYIAELPAGKAKLLGYIRKKERFVLTDSVVKEPKVFMALQFVTRTYFNLEQVVLVRLGISL